MSLLSILAKHKSAIVKKWFDLVVATYPDDTARFLRSQKDPFANPVGQTTLQSLSALLDLLLTGFDRETALSFLDPVIRIRAIQDFTPGRALHFIFDLKTVVRKTVFSTSSDLNAEVAASLLAFEDQIDELGLLAFDIYLQCREKIFDLKANETRNRTYKAFAKAGLIVEPTDSASEL